MHHSAKWRCRDLKLMAKWRAMIRRCTCETCDAYRFYGARGIRVCDEWMKDFDVFAEWAFATGYKTGLTIDRIDSGKGYSPSNCRWATYREQANNRSNNTRIELFGETKTLAEWTRDSRCAVSGFTVHRRIGRGWSYERAITTPREDKYANRTASDMSMRRTEVQRCLQ